MPNWNNYSRYARREAAYDNQERKLINFLSKLQFESILEVGCSFGRITKLLNETFEPKRFLTVDPASDIKRYHEVEFIQTDVMMLPETEKFDLVIAVEVLMHVKNFKPILEKMKRLSNKHVIHLDYWEEKPTWYLDPDLNWKHDYPGEKYPVSNNQAIFYYDVTKMQSTSTFIDVWGRNVEKS